MVVNALMQILVDHIPNKVNKVMNNANVNKDTTIIMDNVNLIFQQ